MFKATTGWVDLSSFIMTLELSFVLTLLMASPILNAQRTPPGAFNGFHNERLELPPISQTLQIAQPNEIPVVLHASGLTKIFVVQQSLEDMGMIEASDQTISLLHHSKFDALGLTFVYDNGATGYNEILQVEEKSPYRHSAYRPENLQN